MYTWISAYICPTRDHVLVSLLLHILLDCSIFVWIYDELLDILWEHGQSFVLLWIDLGPCELDILWIYYHGAISIWCFYWRPSRPWCSPRHFQSIIERPRSLLEIGNISAPCKAMHMSWTEHLVFLGANLSPLVPQYLFGCQSLVWVLLKQLLEEETCGCWHMVWELELLLADVLV